VFEAIEAVGLKCNNAKQVPWKRPEITLSDNEIWVMGRICTSPV